MIMLLINNQSTSSIDDVTSNDIQLSILNTEKQTDDLFYMTVEITNRSNFTFKNNRLVITQTPDDEQIANEAVHLNNIEIKDVQGTLQTINAKETVVIEIKGVVDYTAEQLYIIFESWLISGNNTEQARAIRVTEPITF